MEDKGLLGKIIAIIPGLALMVGTLAVLRMYAAPWLGGITLFGIKGWPVQVLSLNYILLSIIAGMLFRNLLFGGQIPAWADAGFRTTRLFIKTGVIMLGSLYTIQSLLKLGVSAALLIMAFVFGTVFPSCF